MQSAPITALDIFDLVAPHLRRTPSPRADAMAATLIELAHLARPDHRFSASLLRQAYLILAAPRRDDAGPVKARRATCQEIADAIAETQGLGSRPFAPVADLAAVLPWWGYAMLVPGDDGRHIAMRETARREMAELEDAIVRGIVPDIRPAPLAGEKLLEVTRREVEAARVAKQVNAYIDLGVDPLEGGRDGGPVTHAALETLRKAGYTVSVDGRSGHLEVLVDSALRPVKSRRELLGNRIEWPSPAAEIAAAAVAHLEAPAADPEMVLRGEVALEAIDSLARGLRNPSGDPKRDAMRLRLLEAALLQALEDITEPKAKAPIEVIMSALELDASEARVVGEVLIALKPALARATGAPMFD